MLCLISANWVSFCSVLKKRNLFHDILSTKKVGEDIFLYTHKCNMHLSFGLDKITHGEQRTCTETADFQSGTAVHRLPKAANYSSSLCKVGNYPPATGLRANLLQGSKRTHCTAVTFSQPQPGPNTSFMGKRLECVTEVHTVLPEKLKGGSYLTIALCNLYSS